MSQLAGGKVDTGSRGIEWNVAVMKTLEETLTRISQLILQLTNSQAGSTRFKPLHECGFIHQNETSTPRKLFH